MSGILDLLNSDLGKTIISGVAGQTKQPQNKTQDVLTMALPVLMQAMKRNASTPQGAEGLLGALNSKHDGSILDNLGGLFGGGVDDNVMSDGEKILGHVLGNKQQNVTNALSMKSGILIKDLSDHLPIFLSLANDKVKSTSKGPLTFEHRKISPEQHKTLTERLSQTNWTYLNNMEIEDLIK